MGGGRLSGIEERFPRVGKKDRRYLGRSSGHLEEPQLPAPGNNNFNALEGMKPIDGRYFEVLICLIERIELNSRRPNGKRQTSLTDPSGPIRPLTTRIGQSSKRRGTVLSGQSLSSPARLGNFQSTLSCRSTDREPDPTDCLALRDRCGQMVFLNRS